MLGTKGHAPEIGRETRAGCVSVGAIAGGVRREGKNEAWRTDLRRQRFAPRDDPAARGARRPGAGVETKSGGAHDGGRHGSCGDSMLNAHQGAPRRSDDVAARVRSQKLGTTRRNSEAGAHTAADHVASEPLVRIGSVSRSISGLFLGVCAVRTKKSRISYPEHQALDQSEAGIRKPGLGVFTRLSALADWLEITQVSSREIDETWWGWAEETVGRRGPARGSLQPPS